ncbi:MAG: alpha/beta fold hydrolase [Myxococcota bacterium]
MSELVVQGRAVEVPDRARAFGLKRPAGWLRYAEVRGVVEGASLLAAAPWLAQQPRGCGRDVIVIPGFATDDRIMAPLRWYLDRMGHQAQPWTLGVNRGDPETDGDRLAAHIDKTYAGEPLDLVGWSLGGVVARLVARLRPERIRRVVTLGTPVEGGPKYTAAGEIFARRADMDLDAFEAEVHAVNDEGLQSELTVIYSESDGIVGSEAAVDRYNPHARHVRLRYASHTGLIVNPRVWAEVARALAERAG